MRELSNNVLEAPNVADVDFRDSSRAGHDDPALTALPAPRVVFVGAIVSTKLDLDLIAETARRRPDWSFVLVGPVGAGDPSTDVAVLEAQPNVHVVGPRHRLSLPEVLRGPTSGTSRTPQRLTRSVFR